MPRNTARLSQTAPVSFLGSLAESVGACWHLLEGVWGKLSWIHGNRRPTNVFWGVWVLNPCSMEWKHYFGTALNGTVFCQLTILRHQNTKTAAYKVSKNDWVIPFFAIFRFAREKLLVTVSLDHPVFVIFTPQKSVHFIFTPDNKANRNKTDIAP